MKRIRSGKYHQLGLLALLVLILGMLPPTLGASSLHYQPIVGDVVWDTDRSIDTDVVVTDGATLTIASGVTVSASSQEQDVAYPEGLNPFKIEIIVESGGTLIVESGADLMANAAGDWYGVVFLPGSAGNVSGATIRNGVVGVTILGADPTVQGNTFQDMQGISPDLPLGSEGGWAAGIVISGTAAPNVISNTIRYIYAGHGASGYTGADGLPGGGNGEDGGPGGAGGKAYGIWVRDGATPTVRGNNVFNIVGGSGAVGGSGGDGTDGGPVNTHGGNGGNAGDGGEGGKAYGIAIENTGTNCQVQENLIAYVTGGSGAMGGNGGQGGTARYADASTYHGGNGGHGGDAGSGGNGGWAVAIYIERASPLVQDNTLYGSINGGQAEGGGTAGLGGIGASGATPTGGLGEDGGDGGLGGAGGHGGNGGSGGGVVGMIISGTGSPDIRHNVSTAILEAGDAGRGGNGSDGGLGGDGAAGESPIGGNGGNGGAGGNGGDAGSGGHGGNGGTAIGLYALGGATPTVARNRFSRAYGGQGSAGGDAGDAGSGGYGGNGGTGALGGDGGDGGLGGSAGTGGLGGGGGIAVGAMATSQLRLENNLLYSFIGGNPAAGGSGGRGGNGGCGGTADTGGTDGQDQDGVVGGDGGTGGSAGEAVGLAATMDDAEITNNTICNASANTSFGAGGGAGDGGLGCGSGNDAAPGAVGSDGYGNDGVGILVGFNQPTLFNNIVVLHAVGQHTPTGGAPLTYGIRSQGAIPFSNLDYNDVYGWNINYHNVVSGTHDLQEDPRFVNEALEDYHLQEGSPCRNSGTDSFGGVNAPGDDLDGNTRPQGAGYDMGAYEYVEGGACTPVTGVSINGPTTGDPGAPICFTATVSPNNATTPIAYTWDPPPDGQGTSYVCYTWLNPGTYTFTVAVSNCNGTGTAQSSHTITIGEAPCVPLTGVTISGPTSGLAGLPYAFTADVSPANASTPITYTWSNDGLVSGQGTANATYQWSSAGSYDISVEVENCSGTGTAGDDHTINITAGTVWRVFLPLIHK